MNTILLVDDETVICAEIARTLADFGFEIEVVPSVELGLLHAQSRRFDAILVEFNIRADGNVYPRSGNGLNVIRQLRSLKITAPILMFTSMAGELYETVSLDEGADDFIPKTTTIPSLISRLRTHIRRHELGVVKRAELTKA
jgi:DNA-binding response OmpR family regulator